MLLFKWFHFLTQFVISPNIFCKDFHIHSSTSIIMNIASIFISCNVFFCFLTRSRYSSCFSHSFYNLFEFHSLGEFYYFYSIGQLLVCAFTMYLVRFKSFALFLRNQHSYTFIFIFIFLLSLFSTFTYYIIESFILVCAQTIFAILECTISKSK